MTGEAHELNFRKHPVLLDKMTRVVFSTLQANPQGISEYDLMSCLGGEHGIELYAPDRETHDLDTFQRHFLLMHVLYRLADQLCASGEGYLEINPLKIVVHDLQPPATGDRVPDNCLANSDFDSNSTRDYYLDLSHFENTTFDDVSALLESFWEKYLASEHLHEALTALDLIEDRQSLDLEKIRQQYRRLVMEHHPDRGGDPERVQEINNAMDVVTKYYR